MTRLILAICLLVLASCNPSIPNEQQSSQFGDFTIRIIDSCEYIEYDYGILDQRVYSIAHKGNCKNHKK